jgi:hypothetical protein
LAALVEDGVHGLGALGDHRLELVPVDLFGDRRAGVPDEISDGLDGNAIVIGATNCRLAGMPGTGISRRVTPAAPGSLAGNMRW